jgi:molybdenum cofactor cytidylyltransferase
MKAAVEGVLLAAGRSRRAGSLKMALELSGKPLLLWGLESLAAVCDRTIVVAGFQAENIRRLVRDCPGVDVAVNEGFADGMLSSIQAGVRQVRAPRFFLLPGDMPLVRAGVYRELLACAADIVVPACAGRRGHPVLLAGTLIPGILAEPPGSSLGRFIARHGSATVEVGDPGIFVDVDTARDAEKIEAWLRAGGEHE